MKWLLPLLMASGTLAACGGGGADAEGDTASAAETDQVQNVADADADDDETALAESTRATTEALRRPIVNVPEATPTTGDAVALDIATAQATAGRAFPDGSRRVWIHKMIDVPTFQPATPFGADYPLVLRQAWESPIRPQDNPTLLANAGITGVELLWGEGSDVLGHVEENLSDLQKVGLEMAPCLSVNTVDGAVAMIQQYIPLAQRYKSAAKIKVNGVDKYIVAVYGARYSKSPKFWQDVQSRLASLNLPVFFTADLISAISYNGGFFPDKVEGFAVSSFASFVNVFDSGWTFDDGVDMDWTDLLAGVDRGSKPFAGGVMPAYNRENAADGGYSDPEATAKYRRQWSYAVSSGLNWNHVVSWNDVAERHSIWPSAEWSYTRTDISAFYSKLMRGTAWPTFLSTPQLYVTVPQRINVNQASRKAEALVLNSSGAAVTVKAELLNSRGRTISTVTTTVSPSTAGAAVVPVGFTRLPTGRFVRLKATSYNASGVQLQQVVSAPILVYDANEQASGFDYTRIKYNSLPARMALSGPVKIVLNGVPTTAATTATVTPPTGTTVRFTDVLQNAYLAGNRMDQSTPQSIPVPSQAQVSMSGPAKTPASGFYVGRVIDANEKIAYSDPIYVAPK